MVSRHCAAVIATACHLLIAYFIHYSSILITNQVCKCEVEYALRDINPRPRLMLGLFIRNE